MLPRYGEEVVGGAELAIRLIAERLVGFAGWDVGVLTTCALDARTWANHYPAGTTVENGVRVSRFPVERERAADFDAFSLEVLLGPPPSVADQWRFIDDQGPFCPELLAAVAASDADVLIFKPYLYYPTVRGVPLVPGRALMHPAVHDEPALRLGLLPPVFEACEGFVFNMQQERRLLESVAPGASAKPFLVSGFGIEPPASVGAATLVEPPYIVSVGRVDKGKGSLLLAAWFAAYKARRPGPLKLVLAGQVVDAPEPNPDIVLTGVVDEDVKWGLLSSALAVAQPSPYESLSLALLEGWAVGRPALVSASCQATSDHCRASGGGVPLAEYAQFEVAVDRLLGDPAFAARLGAAGYAYVDRRYRWPVILERYAAFVQRFAPRA